MFISIFHEGAFVFVSIALGKNLAKIKLRKNIPHRAN